MSEMACRECRLIVSGNVCPLCETSNLSEEWSGIAIIINAKKSEIAQKIGANMPGKYALKVR